MHPSIRLLHSCRITLFTRANCFLCTTAKQELSTVWDKRHFDYKELDVMKPEGKDWKDLYEYDTPVIHVARSTDAEEDPELSAKAQKLMHRFTAKEVHKKMDVVEGKIG